VKVSVDWVQETARWAFEKMTMFLLPVALPKNLGIFFPASHKLINGSLN
jgi:hypothetical protein